MFLMSKYHCWINVLKQMMNSPESFKIGSQFKIPINKIYQWINIFIQISANFKTRICLIYPEVRRILICAIVATSCKQIKIIDFTER